MGYYVRVFCKSSQVPTLASIQNWLQELQSSAVLDDYDHAHDGYESGSAEPPTLDLETSAWEQIALVYRAGKLPIIVECNRDDGTDESLMREEVEEFVELIGEPGKSAAKRKVLAHLAATKFVVACQLPSSDIEDDGYDANSEFLDYFLTHCEGLIQADGEGFYDGEDIIVELE